MNIRNINFEKWAKAKGMLIDRDETGKYKSLETRAYIATWKDAQAPLIEALKKSEIALVLAETDWEKVVGHDRLKEEAKHSIRYNLFDIRAAIQRAEE